MILQDIRRYLELHQQASLHDIALHFDLDPDVARGMLEFWVSKGRIRHIQQQVDCGGGCNCSSRENFDLYQWNPQFGQIAIETN